MECDRIIFAWLNETYALEQTIAEILDNYENETVDQDLKNRIEEQIEDTTNQAEIIKNRIEELDREIIATDSGIVTWAKNAASSTFAENKDKLVRYSMLEYCLKYLERAYVKATMIIAEECEDEKTIELCRNLLSNEAEDSEILDQELAGTVIDYLNRETIERPRIDWDEEL